RDSSTLPWATARRCPSPGMCHFALDPVMSASRPHRRLNRTRRKRTKIKSASSSRRSFEIHELKKRYTKIIRGAVVTKESCLLRTWRDLRLPKSTICPTRRSNNYNERSHMVKARQAVVLEPFKTTVREVEIPDPASNQILLAAEYSAISAGTELAVYTGTHQWLKDPNLPEWKFPFRSGYSAAGRVLKVGKDFPGGFQE